MTQHTCRITGLVATNVITGDIFGYDIAYNGTQIRFRFCYECYVNHETEIIQNGPIILSLFLNNKIYKQGYKKFVHWGEQELKVDELDLKQIIDSSNYPRTPKEKLENLYHHLHQMQEYDGAQIKLQEFLSNKHVQLYFKNKKELEHYVRSLSEEGYINLAVNRETGALLFMNFTYKGLTEYINIFEEGYNSKNCFIAMSFDDSPEINAIRDAIKEAVRATDYIPILVNEKHISSDKTINDEIIHSLRSCKFCIADFTQHKDGVYFESGFAVGQGKSVIYTCREDEFAKAHFDIKPLQHIIYKTPEELKTALIHKIKAWII